MDEETTVRPWLHEVDNEELPEELRWVTDLFDELLLETPEGPPGYYRARARYWRNDAEEGGFEGRWLALAIAERYEAAAARLEGEADSQDG